MRFLSLFATLAVVLPAFVFAAPQGAVETPVKTFSGPKTGGYIVKLKSNSAKRSSKLKASTLDIPEGAKDLSIINGFSGEFDEATAKALANHEDVEYVEEDGLAHGTATVLQYVFLIYRVVKLAESIASFGFQIQRRLAFEANFSGGKHAF